MSDLNQKAVIDAEQRMASYELKGKKLSFTDRIANLSPEETPFYSSIGSDSVKQTIHQWQTDTLAKARTFDGLQSVGLVDKNPEAPQEGSDAETEVRNATSVMSNVTQIFRKALAVTDTSNALDNYGRARELMYQMDKAGKELKRDIEATMLGSSVEARGRAGTSTRGSLMAGFRGNCAYLNFQQVVGNSLPSYKVNAAAGDVAPNAEKWGQPDQDSGAVVYRGLHKQAETAAQGSATAGNTEKPGKVDAKDIFDMTYNLYLSGSKANIIMFHPSLATFFASLQESATDLGTKKQYTAGDTKFSMYVSEITDPLGQTYQLVPNRWMPEDHIYFYNPMDWRKGVLRGIQKHQLAREGSAENWMIEAEMTLHQRNPYASGVLALYATGAKQDTVAPAPAPTQPAADTFAVEVPETNAAPKKAAPRKKKA